MYVGGGVGVCVCEHLFHQLNHPSGAFQGLKHKEMLPQLLNCKIIFVFFRFFADGLDLSRLGFGSDLVFKHAAGSAESAAVLCQHPVCPGGRPHWDPEELINNDPQCVCVSLAPPPADFT